MRREEAELEAARRNRAEPDADRFEYYAFDESAGLSADAWAVGARLRAGVVAAPATYAGGARRTVEVEEARPEAPGEWMADGPPLAPPAPRRHPPRPRRRPPWRTIASQPSLIGRWRARRRAAGEEESDQPGVFVRGVGAAVIVMGMVWMVMVIVLAVLLQPNGVSGVVLYLGAAVLGLLAILLGVAIRRS